MSMRATNLLTTRTNAPSRLVRRTVGLVWGLALSAGCSTSTTERLRLPPLQTVAHVDLSRYLGTWYEIANFPQSFQRGCTDLSDDYSYAVVGHPDRDYLWILARTPTMADATYQSVVTRLQAQGYETSRLVRTLQVAEPLAGDARSQEKD